MMQIVLEAIWNVFLLDLIIKSWNSYMIVFLTVRIGIYNGL
jgi:hypothetical protein